MFLLKLLKPVGALVSYLEYKVDRLRLAKLIGRGLKVGRNVYIMKGTDFDHNYPFLIEIGDNCRISQGVRVLAHDATVFRDLGVTRIAPVKILEGTFIGERAMILPGVTIGPGAVIAAGSFVNRDIGPDAIAAGNPARPYAKYPDLLEKYSEAIRSSTVLKKEDIEQGKVTEEDIRAALAEDPVAFIRGVPRKDPYYVNADYAEMRDNALHAFEGLIARSSSANGQPAQPVVKCS